MKIFRYMVFQLTSTRNLNTDNIQCHAFVKFSFTATMDFRNIFGNELLESLYVCTMLLESHEACKY